MLRVTILFLALMAALAPASASSSRWHQAEGGQVRIVTAGKPDADGRLRGVLQIVLEPGWKTYWRDPGSSGVPPSVEPAVNSAVSVVAIDFPQPQYHPDGAGSWIGYDRSVDLPLTFTLRGDPPAGPIEAAVFLGICQSICVPVQAQLTVDTETDPDNAEDAALVEAAHAALPRAASKEFGVTLAFATADSVGLKVAAPSDASSAELFLAGGDGYLFTQPEAETTDGDTIFEADIITRPKAKPAKGEGIHYTLVTDDGAVSGLLPYF